MAACAIGIDIGGTRTKVARVDATGAVLRTVTLPTFKVGDPEPFLGELAGAVSGLLADGPAGGLGLSLNGMLSEDLRSSIFNPNSPALAGIDFADWLAQFGLPYGIDEDLNAPTVAEYAFGEHAGSARLMTASIGTGLGAGLVVGGQVLRIFGGTLGDSGHIILQPDGPQCTAGCRGCAEALVSVAGVEREARRRGRDEPAHAVIAAARGGEAWAVEVIEAVGMWLGQWLASIAPILFPQHIVLCGGVAEAGEILLRTGEARFRRLAGPEYTHCTLSISRFGGQAGVIGAAAPFLMGAR